MVTPSYPVLPTATPFYTVPDRADRVGDTADGRPVLVLTPRSGPAHVSRWNYATDPDAIIVDVATFTLTADNGPDEIVTVSTVSDPEATGPRPILAIVRHDTAGSVTITEHYDRLAAMDAALLSLGWGPLHYGPTVCGPDAV